MTFILRWAATFLAFPLGGFLVLPLTPVQHPGTGAVVGMTTGAVIGLAQWWALRGRTDWRWAGATATAMALGTAAAAAVTGGPTSTASAVVTGALTGAAVGVAQGVVLGRGVVLAGAWTVVVSATWALGWLLTANVITDVGDGFAIFGASGAAAVTLLTGLTLAAIFRFRPAIARRIQVVSTAPAVSHVR